MTNQFETLIEELSSAISGEVLDKSRAADRLLDLRNAAESPRLTEAVDHLLRNLPGKTMVATDWWREALDGLRLASVMDAEQTAAL